MLSNGQCGCPDGQYATSSNTCAACSSSCLTCSGSSSGNCLSCPGNQTLTNGACGCTAGYYLNTATLNCEPCDSSCSQCSGPSANECQSCPNNLVFLDTSKCGCASGYYINQTAIECIACDSTCATCTGATSADCDTCKNNLVVLSNNQCGCADGTYLDSTQTSCVTCSSSCATCSGATTCQTCKNNLVLDSKTSTCGCSDEYYLDSSTQTCKACYGACKTCSGSLESNCLTCPTGLTLNSDGECGCDTGYYLNTTTFTCSACDATCGSCSGASSSQCVSCRDGFTLSNTGTCECDAKTYLNTTTNECDACAAACDFCNGPTANDCVSCPSGQILLSDGSCGCASGTYLDEKTSKCVACDSTCDECSGSAASDCLLCKNNLVYSSGSCICPSGQYLEEDSMMCGTCSSSCSACSGPLSSDCTTCPTGWTLKGTKCLESCTSGQYNSADGSCAVCDPSCSGCSGGSSSDCTSCPSGRTLTSDGKCEAITCYSTCKACTGTSAQDCTTCKAGYTLNSQGECVGASNSRCSSGLYYVEGLGTCVSECPVLYYVTSDSTGQICRAKLTLDDKATATKTITRYQVNFNNTISPIFDDLVKRTTITISFDVAKQAVLNYTYVLSMSEDQTCLVIDFTISGHLLPYNTLIVSFDVDNSDNQTAWTVANKMVGVTMFEYYNYDGSTTDAATNAGNAQSVGSKINNVATYGSSFLLQSIHSIRSELMESMIDYFIYMNIAFPPNFISYAMIGLEASDLFLPNIFQKPLDDLEVVDGGSNRLLHETQLEIQLTDVRFLANVGNSVTLFIVVIGAILVFEVIVFILEKKKQQGRFIFRVSLYINFLLRWSYFLNEFISEYQGIAFCSFAALVLTKNFTPDAKFDYVFAVFFFVCSIILIFGLFFILRWVYKHLKAQETGETTLATDKVNMLRRLNLLHKEYHKNTFYQLVYPLLLVLRCFGFSIFLVLVQGSPLCQALFLILSTIGIMIYLYRVRPMEKKTQLILTFIYEFIFLYVSIMALSLHLYSQKHIEDIDTRTNLGFAIIVGALSMMAFNFVSLFFELKELYHIFKEWKQRRAGVQPIEMASEVNNKEGKLEETTNNSQFVSRDLSQITSVTSVKNGLTNPQSLDEKRLLRIDSRASLTDDGIRTDEDRQGGESPSNKLFKKYTLKDVKDLIQEVPEEFITPQNSHRNYGQKSDRITERVLPTSINRLIEESQRSESELSSIRRRQESISSLQDIDGGGQLLNMSGCMPLMKTRKSDEAEDIVQLEDEGDSKKKKGAFGFGFGWAFGKSSDKKAQRAAKNMNKIVPIFEGGGMNWENKNRLTTKNSLDTDNDVVRTIVSARGEENDLPFNLAELRGMVSARDHYQTASEDQQQALRRETLFTQQSDTDDMQMFNNGGLLKLVSEENVEIEGEDKNGIEQIKIKDLDLDDGNRNIKKKNVRKAFTNHMKNFVQKADERTTEDEEERKRSKSKGKARSKSRGKSVDGKKSPKQKKSRPLGKRVSDTVSISSGSKSARSRKSTPKKKKPEWNDRWNAQD